MLTRRADNVLTIEPIEAVAGSFGSGCIEHPHERRSRGRLTKRSVEAATPRARPYYLTDRGPNAIPGFAVRVLTSGRKTFVFRYRPAGRGSAETTERIGEFPVWTVEDARKRAAELRVGLSQGHSPRLARQAARAAVLAERAAPTLAELCDAFLRERAAHVSPGTLANWTDTIGASVHRIGPRKGESVPSALRAALGALRARDVSARDVRAFYEARRLGDPARKVAPAPASARRAVKLLRAVYRFGASEGLIPRDVSPADGVRLASASEPRRAKLSVDEYAALGRALDHAESIGLPSAPSRRNRSRGISRARAAKLTGNQRGTYARRTAPSVRPQNRVVLACIRFLAVSGWRKEEAQTLRWDALDKERGEATLATTKTGESVRPLGTAAFALIEVERTRQKHAGVCSPYVFPRADDAERPIAEIDHVWSAVAHAAALSISPNGLRHAWITTARERHRDEAIAPVVGHRRGTTMTSRYGFAADDPAREVAERVSLAIVSRMRAKPATPAVRTNP